MKRWKGLIVAALSLVLLCTLSIPAQAQKPEEHENPETARVIYDPISLLRYFSQMETFVLRKDSKAVAQRSGKLPFANVPEGLKETVEDLGASEVEIAKLAAVVDRGVGEVGRLVGEFRFDEAVRLSDELAESLDQASDDLDQVEMLVEVLGRKTGAASAPPRSELGRAYSELELRINEKRKMFEAYKSMLVDMLLGLGPKSAGVLKKLGASKLPSPGETPRFQATQITLKISPPAAFVGEKIKFWGRLSSGGEPLGGRKVTLLLDGAEYATAVTDEDGNFRSAFKVPYRYVPELILEALYRPRGEDVGLYLASKSPAVKLRVLFYTAGLNLKLPDKAYPGLKTEIAGKFDYGEHPVLKRRPVEVYLDDSFMSRAEVGPDFSLLLRPAPEIELGKHRLTISAPAKGRYAPVVASAYLNVVQAMPVVKLDLPRWALVPGRIRIGGQVFSEVGPVREGKIKLKLGRAEAEGISAEDGSFAVRLQMGLGPELIGSQALRILVLPQEPWNSAATLSTKLLLVNWVNSGGVLLLLLGLALLVRRRLRRLGLPRRVEKPSIVPQVVEEVRPAVGLVEDLPAGEPHRRILGWYERIARLIQRALKLSFRPQQTLREFLREVSPYLGPAAGLFAELTYLTERLLYSRYRPSEEDARRSEILSKQLEERLKRG